MVYTQHKHGGINRQSRHDELFWLHSSSEPGVLHGGEDTSRPHNVLGTSTALFDVIRVSLLEDGDRLPTEDEFSVLSLDCAVEPAVGKVRL